MSNSVRKPFRSLKNFTRKLSFAFTDCISHIGDSKASLKVKKLNQKSGSLRNSKSCKQSQKVDLMSPRNTSQHPHISTSGHEGCSTTNEYSAVEVVTKNAEALNLSLQINTRLHENGQVSDVDRVNNMAQGLNHGNESGRTEHGVGASAAPLLNTTLSMSSSIKDIQTNSDRNDRERTKGSRSKHFEASSSSDITTSSSRPRENRNSTNLHLSESTNENLTPDSQTLLSTPLNLSIRESVPNSSDICEKLGIITGHPQKPEFAVEDKRRQSFEGWPIEHHLRPEDLAKAGFFYSGYSDCARCFYCSGGLRRWEEGDDVWVEHARWFPKCEFLRQIVGSAFIDVVQELKNNKRKTITYEDVLTELKARGLEDDIPKDVKSDTSELDQDTAVKSLIDAGFHREEVLKAACVLKQNHQTLTVEVMYEELFKEKGTRKTDNTDDVDDMTNTPDARSVKKEEDTIESLRKEVTELRQVGLCKICLDKKVSVVFLPCGHFISCQECSYALQSCPICRLGINGFVKAYLC